MIKLPQLKLKWSGRERILAAACGLALSLVAMDRFVITPWFRHMAALSQEIQNLERFLAKQRGLLDRGESVQVDVDRFGKYLRPGTAPGLQTATLLKEIQGFANQSQVTIQEIKLQPVGENDLYYTFTFDVQAESSFAQWVRFVYMVETSHSLFEIEKTKVGVKEAKPDHLEVSLRLKAIAMRESPPPKP